VCCDAHQVATRLREDYANLPGDALLSSACVAYLGAFTASFRSATWAMGCQLES
jgi:hypothetical protein